MTREEFINMLKEKGFGYEISGNTINVNHEYNFSVVEINDPIEIPNGVKFTNLGSVWISDLLGINPGVEFHNGGTINLFRRETERGDGFRKIYRIFSTNKIEHVHAIDGIDPKRLLNLMIKKGLFMP